MFHLQLTLKELNALLTELGVKKIYTIGAISKRGYISLDAFCMFYKNEEKRLLNGGLSLSEDTFFQQTVPSGVLLHPKQPYIQIKPATFIETEDGIKIGTHGKGVTFCGLTFSFPLLVMNTKDGVAHNVLTEGGFVNIPLFKSLQRWVRKNTRYVMMDGKKTLLRKGICE